MSNLRKPADQSAWSNNPKEAAEEGGAKKNRWQAINIHGLRPKVLASELANNPQATKRPGTKFKCVTGAELF